MGPCWQVQPPSSSRRHRETSTRFSHAGAIIEGGRGTREGKVARLQQVGAHVVENFGDVPAVTKTVLKSVGVL